MQPTDVFNSVLADAKLFLKITINTHIYQFTYILYTKCNERTKMKYSKENEVIFPIFIFIILMYVLPQSSLWCCYMLFSLDPTSCKLPTWLLQEAHFCA